MSDSTKQSRRRFLALLRDKKQGRKPARPQGMGAFEGIRPDGFDEMLIWMRQARPEEVIWSFGKAIQAKLFTPLELWLLLFELVEAVPADHIEALEGVYSHLAALRDDDSSLPRHVTSDVSFAHVLCGVEWVLGRNGAKRARVQALRRQHLGDYGEVISVLQSWTGGGNWHVEIPSGLPSLGKRR